MWRYPWVMRFRWLLALGSIVVVVRAAVACGGGGDGAPGGPADAGGDDATTGFDGPTGDAPPPVDVNVPDASPEASPPRPPFDWVGVVGTGQSLSVGATSTSMTVTQPFHNVKLVDRGPDPKYPIDDAGPDDAADGGRWATAPLVEPIRTNVHAAGPGYDAGHNPK